MTRRNWWIIVGSMLAGSAPAVAQQPSSPTAPAAAGPDMKILQLQVVLDRLGFSPGTIDGKTGQTLTIALKGYQAANGLTVSGKPDPATLANLQRFASIPGTVNVKLGASTFAYQYSPNIPHGEDQQADLPALNYRNVTELLAERYHTSPETLVALNPPGTRVKAGSVIRVPNVFNTKTDYAGNITPQWRQTLVGLNVPSGAAQADHIKVSKSAKALRVFDKTNRIIAQFPVTTGSEHDPLPIGQWKIVAADYNPKFHYNPALFWDAKQSDTKAMLPPGPNGPVGVVWLDLSKAHYGIHGTPEPGNIGRTESHGCVRLTNWDAARLATMVGVGTPVTFEP
jgi:lipoprotein-anchoring transpeptidase ErfK/SrfK